MCKCHARLLIEELIVLFIHMPGLRAAPVSFRHPVFISYQLFIHSNDFFFFFLQPLKLIGTQFWWR